MRQLDAGDRTMTLNEPRDASKRLDVIVAPQAQVPTRNAATRFDRGGLGDYDSGAAERHAPEMDKVIVSGKPICGACVHAHRRQNDAVS